MLLNKKGLVKLGQKALNKFIGNKFNFAKIREAEKEDVEVSKKLVNTIDTEIKETEANYEPIAQNEKESFLNANRWVLFENENSINLELKKSSGEFDISVRFAAKSPEVINEERESQESERFVDFYVSINRNNQPNGLFVEAVSIDSSVNINQIHFSENVKEYSQKFLNSNVIDSYTGPEFNTLDEKLQQEFLDLFVSLGVNDELGSFIEVLSVDKDERLYINWLKIVKNNLV